MAVLRAPASFFHPSSTAHPAHFKWRPSPVADMSMPNLLTFQPTTPRRYFIELLTRRVAEPDCIASGWLLDGFPHTAEQAEALKGLGMVPDKVRFNHMLT